MRNDNPMNKQPVAMDVAACTCANLRKATRVVTQAFDAALRPSGLKATQFTVLATLGSEGELPLTRLASALVMDRTTLTRNLKPLVRDGLVHIGQEADQRVRNVSLSAKGESVLAAARPCWEQAQSRVVDALGPTRWSGLLEDLKATVETGRNP